MAKVTFHDHTGATHEECRIATWQVPNPAAKLFTLNPKLTPTEVIKSIVNDATKSSHGKPLLIDPKGSAALLESKR